MSYYNNNRRYKREILKGQLLQQDRELLQQLLLLSDRDRLIFQKTTNLFVGNLKRLFTNGHLFTKRTRALLRQYLDIDQDLMVKRYANPQLERIEKGTFLSETEQSTEDYLSEYGLDDY